jgi:IclR family acetate operon transcriptional repressor
VDRALALLEAVSRASDNGLELTVIAQQVGLIPSTAYRLLRTLEARGFVRRHQHSKRYILGPALKVLSDNRSTVAALISRAVPYLRELARISGETANLAIARNMVVVFVDQVPSGQLVRAVPRLDVALPMYATAAGKAILGHMSAAVVASYLSRPRAAFTSNTLTLRSSLEQALAETRRAGYAIDNEEFELGGKCVAAPVVVEGGHVAAALSITAPATRMPKARLHSLGDLARRAARKLSDDLTRSVWLPAMTPESWTPQ